MTTTATTANSPPCAEFSTLPPELRSQVWRDALPESFNPTFFIYKKGCWQPRYILESDEDYDAENFYGIHMIYRHDFLDRVEADMPMFFVNREARGIVRGWLSQQGIEVCFRKGAAQPAFLRHFNPLRDAVYVPVEKYNEFCNEPLLRPFEPDLEGRTYSYGGREVPNLAIPAELFWDFVATSDDIILEYYVPAILLVVVNAQAELDSVDKDGRWRQWEFGSTRERALVWDLENRKFNWDNGEPVCDRDMYDRIEEVANKDVIEKLIRDRNSLFEIRPVMAVRR